MTAQPAADWLATTPRLRLRLLDPDDAPALRAIAAGSWFCLASADPGADPRLSPWAVVRRDTGEVIGFCGFFVRPARGTTMGYAILPAHQGQGYATEAAAAVLTWAERNGIEVYASIRPPNPASARVLEKIGMRLAGSYTDEDGPRHVYRRAASTPAPPPRRD